MRIDYSEQGSHEWHLLRHSKVTGTTLKSALGTDRVQKTLMHKLIAERMTEPQIDEINSPAIVRGKELEPLARRAVIEKTGIPFVEVGMLLPDDLQHFGVSPDAVYMEDGEVIGGLEIKCPDSKKHIEYLLGNKLPSEYADQVKAPFLVSDKIKWWYFASYDDRNYECPLFLIRVDRTDFQGLQEDRERLTQFLRRVDETHLNLTF